MDQRTLEVTSISLERLEELRELAVCVWRKPIKGQHHRSFHDHGMDWGMNPLGPTFRAETQTDPTVPPLPEGGGGEATAEPEDPSAELLRRVLAGAREPDVSRVKLAIMPSSYKISRFCRQPKRRRTGSRSDWRT